MRQEIVDPLDVAAIEENWHLLDSEHPTIHRGERHISSISEIPSIRRYAAQKIEFLVDQILAAGSVNAITGESGAGKTTVVLGMCAAVATGESFAGFQTQKRKVLVLDRENGLATLVEKFDRMHINDGSDFILWGGWAGDEPPAPFSPIVINWVKSCDPAPLIVVDSLIGFNAGEENSATETRAFMHQLRRLADLGCAVILLHNSGKSDSSREYRGSSDIKASIDVGYHLANIGADPLRLELVRMRAFKARFAVQQEIILRFTDGQFQIDGRGPIRTNQKTLIDLLVSNPGVRKNDFEKLAIEKGVTRSKARQFIDDGVRVGRIRVEDGPHNTQFHTWEPPKDQSYAG